MLVRKYQPAGIEIVNSIVIASAIRRTLAPVVAQQARSSGRYGCGASREQFGVLAHIARDEGVRATTSERTCTNTEVAVTESAVDDLKVRRGALNVYAHVEGSANPL